MPGVRRVGSAELSCDEVESLRALFAAAWTAKEGLFTEQDWDHAFGGEHFVIAEHDRIVSHASVVPRHLSTQRMTLRTGYVEAVATLPPHQGQGLASAVMARVTVFVDANYELGALDTGIPAFYERFGWRSWEGPTSVLPGPGIDGPGAHPTPTPEEDGSVMVRLTPSTPDLDLAASIACDWRAGDAW